MKSPMLADQFPGPFFGKREGIPWGRSWLPIWYMDGSMSWDAFASLNGTPVDIVLLYPYKDVSGVQMSGEATQVKRGVSFVVFDVHFSFVA